MGRRGGEGGTRGRGGVSSSDGEPSEGTGREEGEREEDAPAETITNVSSPPAPVARQNSSARPPSAAQYLGYSASWNWRSEANASRCTFEMCWWCAPESERDAAATRAGSPSSQAASGGRGGQAGVRMGARGREGRRGGRERERDARYDQISCTDPYMTLSGLASFSSSLVSRPSSPLLSSPASRAFLGDPLRGDALAAAEAASARSCAATTRCASALRR